MLRFWPEKKCQQKVSFNRCFGKKNLKEMMCEAIFLKKGNQLFPTNWIVGTTAITNLA